MADDPEMKEDDPVSVIRASLTKALGTLKKLLGQEDKELKEEMDEVESGGGSQNSSNQGEGKGDAQASTDQGTSK